MDYDGSIKIDTSLELSHLQEDIYSLENILDKILESTAGFGLRLVKSGIESASKRLKLPPMQIFRQKVDIVLL